MEMYGGVDSKRNYLFVAGTLSIQVFDISDPTTPRLVQFVPLSDIVEQLEVQGDYLIVAGRFALYTFLIDLPPAACGDANYDDAVNVGDAVFLINFVFKGGLPPDPLTVGDCNCDGQTNVADVVYLVNFVFKGGAAPCTSCQ